ncbi:MAG: hypothetical protein DRP13_02425 [Candidatus Aenigmatarchaeota archaeon]|nr:MAG: hypothetical protein DRP18_04935 [Candidatus Aenigmarchaeota archaeon]RLJ08426.1 MAG: hypothetical protein DRP13_02425 [Candidatus Aenigmarchaeota archaeon]RLJ08491.1 MAG: hypothetical protein DRP16_01305 [Candidatus Aenigmarchaeota archaeon]
MKKCPNKERNSQECGCTYAECERKGVCCECIRHHRERGEIPGCLFPKQAEKTYDRSVRNFIRSFNKFK